MAKKTTVYGSFTSPRPQVRFSLIYTNGTSYTSSKSVYTPVIRRLGRSSSITSQSGIDGRFRPCVHTQELYSAKPLSLLQPYQFAQYNPTPVDGSTVHKAYVYNQAYDAHARRYTNFVSGVNAISSSLSTVQWASLSATALQTMLPTFHSKNSFVNYVLELKDFKRIIKYMSTDIGKKLNTLRLLLGFSKSDKPMAKLSKMYLSYQFGWKPLFNDLVSFISTASGFVARYDELMRREGKPQQSYWGTWIAGTAASETVHYSNGVGDGPEGGWTGPFLCKYRARVILGSTEGIRYHATVRYRYQMPDEIRSAVGKLKVFLDLLGIQRNPAILWNAIPFSFIIDWVVNVSGYLERLRVDNVDFKTEILDFCHSARIQRNVSYQLAGENYHVSSGYIPLGFTETDSCTKIAYERKLGIPNYLTAIQTSGLNPREFSLAGALWGAKRR